MNILVFSQYFWPENFRINELVAALARRASVTVLTGKPNYPEGTIFPGYSAAGVQREDRAGVEIIRIPLIPRGRGSPFRLALNYLSFAISGYLVSPLVLRGRSFDVVLVYAPSPLLQALPAIFVSWLKGVPLVVWVQDLWPESLEATGSLRNQYLLWIIKKAVGFIYRHADSILVQSPAFFGPVARQGAEIGKIKYFPNHAEAVFNSQAKTSICAEALASEIGPFFSIVFAGNVGIAQSLETIVEAAERLRLNDSIRFVIIGSGSQKAWLATEVRKRQLMNIRLVDRLPPSDLPVVFSAASALLVTLRDQPIFAYTVPSKLQTYLAAGKPIIAALNGEGARVVTEAAAGISCLAGDSVALADAVLYLSRLSSQDRERMGYNGRQYAKSNYDLEMLTAQLVDHFEHLTCQHPEGLN
ncbi:MAG: glycosyltransferase family 4 protein [Rhodocyclaceae bacterium]|nr:glycosyltransferase family 4 protein [Rhodocyclaceae bacterium]